MKIKQKRIIFLTILIGLAVALWAFSPNGALAKLDDATPTPTLTMTPTPVPVPKARKRTPSPYPMLAQDYWQFEASGATGVLRLTIWPDRSWLDRYALVRDGEVVKAIPLRRLHTGETISDMLVTPRSMFIFSITREGAVGMLYAPMDRKRFEPVEESRPPVMRRIES